MDDRHAARRAPQPSNAAARDARLGTIVRGKWRLDALLGTGGMASVYAATHTNGRRAALKILHAQLATDPAIRERFVREGYLGNKIEHPGRVACLDNDETEDGAQFLVLELLEGETLEALWRREKKRLSVPVALGIADQLLDFLDACHAAGIVHRDIKPANIFVTKERVKVLDFGVAQLREGDMQHTRVGLTLGTPAFMAPEQARGAGDKLDGRADLFSVGAVLHAMLTGVRLHKGRSSDESLILAATEPAASIATLAPDLPIDVIALVDKSLSWDRRARYASANEMRDAVLAILERFATPSARAARAAPRVREPAHAVATEAPPPPTDDDLPEGHPDVERVRSVMKQLERALPAVRQYGWAHPEAQRRLSAAYDDVAAALREAPNALRWDVRPYSFAHRGCDVWEPAAPLDGVPYALFDGGIRTMRLLPGLPEAELRSLVTLFLLDPRTDLAPEDDLATTLWDMGLSHVEVEVADVLADGDAALRERSFEQSGEIEEQARRAAAAASRAEARAMSVSTSRGDAESPSAELSALDPTVRAALAAQLALTPERLRERFADALVDGLAEARAGGDEALVRQGLQTTIARQLLSDRAMAAHDLSSQLTASAKRRPAKKDAPWEALVAGAAFGGVALEPLVRGASTDEAGVAAAQEIAKLDGASVPEALKALRFATQPAVLSALLSHIETRVRGHELAVAKAVASLGGDTGRALVQTLARAKTREGNAALTNLTSSMDPEIRIEAVVATTSPERLRDELLASSTSNDGPLRLAAVRAMAARGLKDAIPELVRRIEDPSFHATPMDERRSLLDALHGLDGARAELIAVALLSQHGLVGETEKASTRLICARFLGAIGATPQARTALEDATKKWWWNSDELRSAATTALQAVASRRTNR